MQANFQLENPETFSTVFPWTQVEACRTDSTGRQKQSSKLLQEKVEYFSPDIHSF